MTKEERRRLMGAEEVEKIRSRLVQIKIALTAKKVRELEERVNVVEAAYLRQKPPEEGRQE